MATSDVAFHTTHLRGALQPHGIDDVTAPDKKTLLQDLALKIGRVGEAEIATALGPIRGFDGATNASAMPPGVSEETTWWSDYWRHHHVDREAHPELYDLRAPGQLVAVYLVYFVPLFVVGLCGWITMHWPVSNAAGASTAPLFGGTSAAPYTFL